MTLLICSIVFLMILFSLMFGEDVHDAYIEHRKRKQQDLMMEDFRYGGTSSENEDD